MNIRHKATQIRLLDFHSAPMRAFHMTWLAFFLCFFGWFGLAPLMPMIRTELHLTKEQVGNSAIAAVAITILVRLLDGLAVRPHRAAPAYTWLLVLGSLPVMGVGLAHDYTSFLIFRLAIGAIGASFVITQYHTSVMFAPNIVGTANATAAGWGNLGGGVTQIRHAAAVRRFHELRRGELVELEARHAGGRRRAAADRHRLLFSDPGHARRRLQASCGPAEPWSTPRVRQAPSGSLPRSAGLGAGAALRRFLRHRADHRQLRRALFHRLLSPLA